MIVSQVPPLTEKSSLAFPPVMVSVRSSDPTGSLFVTIRGRVTDFLTVASPKARVPSGLVVR